MSLPREFGPLPEAPTVEVPVNMELCKMLRTVLTKAERGEIQQGVVIGLAGNGAPIEAVCLAPGIPEALMNTWLEVLQAKIVSNMVRAQNEAPKSSSIIRPGRPT